MKPLIMYGSRYKHKDQWIALDSSPQDGRPGRVPAEAAQTWTDLPAALFHRVSIRVVVEERSSSQVSTTEALRHEAAASDLNGAVVLLTHRLSPTALGGRVTRPRLQIDSTSIDGQAVAEAGSMMSAPALGERLFSRPGALASGREGETTAEWVEFEFLYPSGRTEIARRICSIASGPPPEGQELDPAPLCPPYRPTETWPLSLVESTHSPSMPGTCNPD